MTAQQRNTKIQSLDQFEKMRIYWHYVVRHLSLKHIYNFPFSKRSFEDFCNEPDSRVSEGLIGTYWRFADEIYLTEKPIE